MNPKCLFNLYIVDFDFIVISPKLGLTPRDLHGKWRLRHSEWFTKAHMASQGQTPVFRLHLESSCIYILSSLIGNKAKKNRLSDARSPSGRRRLSPISLEFMEEKREDLLQAQVHNGDIRGTWNTCLIRTGHLAIFELQPLVRIHFPFSVHCMCACSLGLKRALNLCHVYFSCWKHTSLLTR